ncbi:leucine-rich repeat, immunoglobulin-like domain and transmembrane domain-containing protein 1 [Protobothrops mucrosquamatus]|uniref:leucine-rich repeat, immunoglobulin-like domain and transmembrane domain-containing protein 1 n=1 Tax=Protobothrops mucrosquamatus TaxID=103944 RepID=UPI0010FAED88|nr:leucine-rich repeat, immunoglobulin-like domain and transmembrane domain-containing protein 1 [Protobothrops mucrosquamatus]
MWVTVGFLCCLTFGSLPWMLCFCPSQCSCSFYSISERMRARAILCNDPEMTLTPVNFPGDTFKLRIEKTAIRRVPGESFHSLHNLEFLWMPYNALTSLRVTNFRGLYQLQELRLAGNVLTSFPWETLPNMPQLRLLDLHNNQIASIPSHAAQYIRNITYLDISSNKLMMLPQELIVLWSNLQAVPYFLNDNSKIILGLQDNPWTCDCSVYEMAHFLNFQSPNIAFIEPKLRCFNPEKQTRLFFSQVELRKCQSPVVHTSVAKVKSILGSTVLLRCGTTGVPVPELSWRRADGKPFNGTVHQEISSDGIRWSILELSVVSYFDSGEYICKAANFLGATEAFISLIVTDSKSVDDPGADLKGVWKGHIKGIETAAYKDNLLGGHSMTTSTFPTLRIISGQANTERNLVLRDQALNMKSDPKIILESLPATNQESQCLVRSVRVIGDSDHSVSLAWKAPQANTSTEFSILYAIFGERDMRRINVEPKKTRTTINGLMPKTKYIACICVKGLIPKKEQCIIFSTDEVASAGGTQKLINVVVISVACVIAVPLTLVVCCGALKRRCKKYLVQKPKDMQDSYVTFEALSPGTRTKETEGEYLTHHIPDESNRLLSSRSSVDSEAVGKADGQLNEYFC